MRNEVETYVLYTKSNVIGSLDEMCEIANIRISADYTSRVKHNVKKIRLNVVKTRFGTVLLFSRSSTSRSKNRR